MKRRPIRSFLVIAISCFIVIFPTYLRFSNLTEIKLFSTDLIFDDSGDVDQFEGKRHELGAFLSCVLSVIFHPGANLIEPFRFFPFQSTSYSQGELILRC